ncbi:MAG: hypothetical protein AAGA44_15300 [Pseudomonadota bacterium]
MLLTAKVFVLAALAMLTACAADVARPPKSATVIALMPPDGAFGDAPDDFAAEVTALTAGSLELRSELLESAGVPVLELFDRVDSGEIPLAVAPPAAFFVDGKPLSIGPLLVSGMPFGFSAEEFLSWYQAGGGEALIQSIYDRRSRSGNVIVYPLVFTASEPPGFFIDPVPENADAFNKSGITYRINMLGAQVMKTAFPDLTIVDSPPGVVPVDDMCTGKIRGAELGTLSVYERLFFDRFSHENGENIVECGFRHLYLSSWQQPMLSNWLLISRVFYDGLEPHEQQAIRSAATANLARSLARDLARGSGVVEKISAAGATVHASLPEEIMARLRAATEVVLKQASNADPDFALIVESMTTFARENQSTLLYDGIPADERFNLLPAWRSDFATVVD